MKNIKITKTHINYIVFIGIILSIVFAVIAKIGYEAWTQASEAAYYGCIASVADDLKQKVADSFVDKTVNFSPLNKEEKLKLIVNIGKNKEWIILPDEKVTHYFSKVTPRDCARFKHPEIDPWSNKLKMAFKINSDQVEILFWSKGSDGISGTQDDFLVF